MLRTLISASSTVRRLWLAQPLPPPIWLWWTNRQPELALAGVVPGLVVPPSSSTSSSRQSLESILRDCCLWFAVPKSKISRQKKRLKTTLQKRIPLKQNIVTDPRTGQVTLKHHMPFNWKDFLPKLPTTDTTNSNPQ